MTGIFGVILFTILLPIYLNASVRPKAVASCSGTGDNVSCLCGGIDGTPPADTTWLKGNNIIKSTKRLSTTLDKDDMIANKEGVYTCEANSANLIDVDTVTLSKPKEISFTFKTGRETKLTCKVVGTVIPAPVFLITTNNAKGDKYGNGEKSLPNADNLAEYKCVAKNIFGSVTERMFSGKGGKNGKDGEDGKDGGYTYDAGAIVGIVIGVLVLVIVVAGLVYWFGLRKKY